MKKYDREIFRSDTKFYRLNLTKDGQPVNLTGCTIYFTAKKNLSISKPDIAVKITEHLDAGNGKTVVKLASADTDIDAGIYFYDIQLKDADGNISTLISGKLSILEDVTKDV